MSKELIPFEVNTGVENYRRQESDVDNGVLEKTLVRDSFGKGYLVLQQRLDLLKENIGRVCGEKF